MSHIEEMQRYISRTKVKNRDRYCMVLADLCALYDLTAVDPFGALCLAFDYGQAKGQRALKAGVPK